METFIALEYAPAYEISIMDARRFTEEEKKDFAEWFRDVGMTSVGPSTYLPGVTWEDLPRRQPDGSFCGCSNHAWIISEAERDHYLALNSERVRASRIKELHGDLDYYRSIIANASRQSDLPSREEARRREKRWNDINNDGGDGYVPHVYSRDEYDWATAKVQELEAELSQLEQ